MFDHRHDIAFKNSIIVTLGGEEYRLKPTFQAIMDIEDRLGSIIALAVKASEGNMGLKEMTVIIWATMEQKINFEQVGNLLLSGGIVKISPTVRDLLTLCLVGLDGSENSTD
ncbi:MAG: GTA-gp10 family protein [Emcibacter sp.]|nr:GTA-gp10 family protein [Emcibacter sp.]